MSETNSSRRGYALFFKNESDFSVVCRETGIHVRRTDGPPFLTKKDVELLDEKCARHRHDGDAQ